MEIQTYNYTLKTDNGGWLGQIVLTSDGLFSAVTDWGNFSYAWRSFGDTFKSFLSQLNVAYFAEKMAASVSYSFGNSKKINSACYKFAEHILPALQKVLKEEIATERTKCSTSQP